MTGEPARATGRNLRGDIDLHGAFRQVVGPSLAAAWLVVVAACNAADYDLGPGDTLHPNDVNAPPADAAMVSADSLPEGMSPEALQAWKEARDAIWGAQTVLRLGTDERGPELFGAITDVEVDANGNLVVFDMSTQEIRFFDPRGQYMGGFGGFGDGPTEFRNAARLSMLRDGRIVVPISRALKVLARSEDGWELDTDNALLGDGYLRRARQSTLPLGLSPGERCRGAPGLRFGDRQHLRYQGSLQR